MKTKRQKEEEVKLDSNPFIAGMPVLGSDFFNREDIINSVKRFILSANQYNYLIFGQRRIGKTSLLRKIEKEVSPENNAFGVYFNLQDKATFPLHTLLYELATHIIRALNINLDVPQNMFLKEGAADYMQHTFLPELLKNLPPDKPLVLLFDEFDVMGDAEYINDKRVVGIRSYEQFIPFLTRLLDHIMMTGFNIKFIFAIGRNYKDLNPERYGQITKFNEQVELEYFDKGTVFNLLEKTKGTIPFATEVCEKIFELTSGQPYFTQALAYKVFDCAQKSNNKSVTVEMVNRCMPETVKSYGGGVFWIWDTLRPSDQVVLYLMALSVNNEASVTEANLKTRAVDMFLEPATRELDEILARLLNVNFITKSNEGYAFTVPLFREWIVSEIEEADITKQFNDNKEVDFNLTNARYYFDKEEYKKCLPFAETVLQNRPSHFEALSITAKSYRFLGDLDKAQTLYKNAYAVNPVKVEKEYVELLKGLLEKKRKRGEDYDEIEYELYKTDKTKSFDLFIIKQIEKQLNIKLEEVDELKYDKNGYTVDKNKKVTGLILFDNGFTNICLLKDLTNLIHLDLENNGIEDISPLQGLKSLKQLHLINNNINNIYPLRSLKNLLILDLDRNNIQDISPINVLINLEKLNFTSNQITEIPLLNSCKNLVELALVDNQIKNITNLHELKNLTILDLAVNNISDIMPLKDLKKLTYLNLQSNQINDIFILSRLKKLSKLYLFNNQIKDIASIKELNNLTQLNLYDNPIETLPVWITEFNMRIQWKRYGDDGYITFFNNPLKSPPVDIVKQGQGAVINYFKQLKIQGRDNIYEAKLMIVGDPGSGKTSLMNKMFDKDFPVPNDQKSTLGIEVRQNWLFAINDDTSFKAHVWDFGGQQIQYMLHQFFLTSDCVYILMTEKRREILNYDYWLNIINILGSNSPVIALFNEIRIDSATSFIYDEKKYKELFPNLNIHKLDVNLSVINDGRFDHLLGVIKEKLSGLEHIGSEVPAGWVNVRKELETLKDKRHIDIKEYFCICNKYDITDEPDMMLILRYFHLLGIVLHFSEDENLCDTLFLDPNWTVDAVYSALSDDRIVMNNGVFKKEELYKTWSDKGYGTADQAKLLQLMLKDNFDLCYKLRGSRNSYIIPLLLPKLKPEYKWDSNGNLQFRFQYPFMPKGIVSRLVVRMHEYIDDDRVWNDGVVFEKKRALAEIVEQETIKEGLKIISIRLKGNLNSCKELLTLIREEVKRIQDSSFPNLPYTEMIPCNCNECANVDSPYFFDYDHIDNYINRGKSTIDCRKSTNEVGITQLIGAVFDSKEIGDRFKQQGHDERNINIDVSPHIHMHQEQGQKQEQTQQQSVEVHQEVVDVQNLFKNLKDDVIDEINIEIEDRKEVKRISNELEKVQAALNELEKAASNNVKYINAGVKGRLTEFFDNLADEDSRLNRGLKMVSKGKDKAQSIAKLYNNFAPFFCLPSVPEFLIKKGK